MKLEWDEAKRKTTLAKRGLDFADAWHIFAGPHFTKPDRRRDYGEDRFTSYGELDDRACVVVWTQRKENRRIISLRKADAEETEFIRRVMGGPG